MRSLGIILATTTALCAPALAADMPGKAPVYTEAKSSWGGFYGYAGGTYGWTDIKAAAFEESAKFDIKQVMPTFGAMYRVQFGRAVVGVGSSFTWAGHASSIFDGNVTGKIKYYGDATAQFGIAINNGLLAYVEGGAAWANAQVNIEGLTSSANHFGWVAKAGLDIKLFSENWVGGIQYAHHEFGCSAYFGLLDGCAKSDSVTARIAYRFTH